MSTEPDVAEGLIAGLEAEAAFVELGAFGIDVAKAREKLRDYQLADPELYSRLSWVSSPSSCSVSGASS